MFFKDQSYRRQRIREAIAIAAVVTLLVIGGVLNYTAFGRLQENRERIRHTNQLLSVLDATELVVKDAETGQRGFIITGADSYLEPFDLAMREIARTLDQLEQLSYDQPEVQTKLPVLRKLINERVDELQSAIVARRQGGLEAGKAAVDTDVGKHTMDMIRKSIKEMRVIVAASLSERRELATRSYELGRLTTIAVTLVGFSLIAGLLYLIERNRRLDSQMRWFLEQVQDYAIFTMNADRRATSWNQGVGQVLGYKAEEFVGKDVLGMLFTPEAIEDGSAEAEFRTAERNGVASDDRWMLRKDGQRFWASGATNAIFSEGGKLVGFSKVMRDLTHRKHAQDELAALASKLSESDRRKDEFLAVLAHELRNPLAPIRHAIELMGMNELDSENEELRQVMSRQADQMVHLIDDLLDVSRISRGKIELRNEVVDLCAIIQSSVESSIALISQNRQHIEVRCDMGRIFVNGDSGRLTQVVSNLLTNASKYSGEGCEISVYGDIEELSDVDWATIRVVDNGIGIAADQIDSIFEMFEQVNNTLERGEAGLGIGLTLVRTLVEMHGGTVSARSDGIGLGSEFVIRLPRANQSAATPHAEVDSELLTTRSFRILVVEDQSAIRVILSRLLEKLGHKVETAESGADAMRALDHFKPQIIFSDISMPGMTGYELARRLRERSDMKDVSIVAMTGYGQANDREKAIQSGFDEHLVKPVDARVLKQTLAKIADIS
ncbi:CHASE3 domain-containing protein [Rubripirellula amarantea]|nr:CHASE3 domain-containing protein [Rubripirellula amarantea]